MAQLQIVGPGLNPDDLWRNHFYLERRIQALEARVAVLTAKLEKLEWPLGALPQQRPSRPAEKLLD